MSDETRRIPPMDSTNENRSEQDSTLPEVDEPTIRTTPVGTDTNTPLPEVDEPTIRTAPVGTDSDNPPTEVDEPTIRTVPVGKPPVSGTPIVDEPTMVNGKTGAEGPEPEPQSGDDWPSFDWKDGFSSWTEEDIAGGAAADGAAADHKEAPMPEEPEQKGKKKKKKKSLAGTILGALAYLFGVLLVSYGLATLAWNWAGDVLALNKAPLTASVTIEETDTLEMVADTLAENGLIEHPFLFKLYATLTHKTVEDGKIVSGTYELTTDMDYSALLTNIGPRSTSRETVTVMIPEGYTAEEIFALLEENGVCSAEELKAEAETGTFDYDFLSGVSATGYRRLEGYLFPDTYEFYKKSSPATALAKLLDNYQNRFTDEMAAQAESMGLTQNEIMIVASIIEKETDGSDQNDIASVIYNRLAKGNRQTNGYLQMDSTIQYLLSERKESLTSEDLEIDSPYNTYKYAGLPEGCICNPGLKSIKAALNPTDTNYYYFILGDDGATHFFSSYDSFVNYKNSLGG